MVLGKLTQKYSSFGRPGTGHICWHFIRSEWGVKNFPELRFPALLFPTALITLGLVSIFGYIDPFFRASRGNSAATGVEGVDLRKKRLRKPLEGIRVEGHLLPRLEAEHDRSAGAT